MTDRTSIIVRVQYLICNNCNFENSSIEFFCRRCRSNLHYPSPYCLQIEDFAYPSDIDNLNILNGIEPFPSLILSAVNIFYKSFSQKKLLRNTVQVSEKNYPRLLEVALELGDILCLQFFPEVYILPSKSMNAFTIGGKEKPIMVLHSALFDVLNLKELSLVLGHEMGHIKAGHQPMHTVGYLLANGITLFGFSLLSIPLELGLKSWSRHSEFTADRASLLISNDVDLTKRVFKKIIVREGETHKSRGPQEFREFFELWRTHPFTENRIKNLKEFFSSKEYQKVLSKITLAKIMQCPFCKYRINSETIFCPGCGRSLV